MVNEGYQWLPVKVNQAPSLGARFDLIWEKIHNKVFILFFSWGKNAQLTQKCFSFSIVDTVMISTSKIRHSAKRVFPKSLLLFVCLPVFCTLGSLFYNMKFLEVTVVANLC